MRKTEILDGNKLHTSPVLQSIPNEEIKCAFLGQGFGGQAAFVPFNNDLLSRHILFLGGIGTGKTNAFFQLIKQLRHSLTDNDVMIIFDSKGDFHELFCGILSLATMTGPKAYPVWIIGISSERLRTMTTWKRTS